MFQRVNTLWFEDLQLIYFTLQVMQEMSEEIQEQKIEIDDFKNVSFI